MVYLRHTIHLFAMQEVCMLDLTCGDGLAMLLAREAGSLAAVITDPPYGTTALPWDRAIDYLAFWRAVDHAVTDTGMVVVFCAQPMMIDLVTSNRRHFRYELIWHKTMPVGFLDAGKRPLRVHENIAIFCRRWRGARNRLLGTYHPQFTQGKPYQKRAASGTRCAHYGEVRSQGTGSEDGRRYPIDVLTFPNRAGGKSPHPTAKPVELLKWLVATYTNPGDVIGDPYMGAGSTGVAAVALGRGFVGAEINEDYYRVACARIAEAGRQPNEIGSSSNDIE